MAWDQRPGSRTPTPHGTSVSPGPALPSTMPPSHRPQSALAGQPGLRSHCARARGLLGLSGLLLTPTESPRPFSRPVLSVPEFTGACCSAQPVHPPWPLPASRFASAFRCKPEGCLPSRTPRMEPAGFFPSLVSPPLCQPPTHHLLLQESLLPEGPVCPSPQGLLSRRLGASRFPNTRAQVEAEWTDFCPSSQSS